MRTIIAGSRQLGSPSRALAMVFEATANCGWPITSVVSGHAAGADLAGEGWACWMGIPWVEYPARWRELGMRAGRERNLTMARDAQALVAVWDGHSRGTAHMIETARKARLAIHVHVVAY